MSDKEVASVALVQVHGLVRSEGYPQPPFEVKEFSGDDAAVDEDVHWVAEQVQLAHGNIPIVFADNVKFMRAVDDCPSIKQVERLIFWITTEGGPAWGMVIRF